MQEIIFRKRVSKGSRFNQIYIPKEMETIIEVNDLVEIRLLKKHIDIYYKNIAKLSDFKEYIVKNIFSTLQSFSGVKTVFIVGSFLHETLYNDIDIVAIADKDNKNLEKNISEELTKRFSQRFHVLLFTETKARTLLEKDPLTISMLDSYISNRKTTLDHKRTIDKKHIEFLLMMPEDLLKIILPSKAYYDNIRRLVTIEKFLNNKSLGREIILTEVKKKVGAALFGKIKNNEDIDKNELSLLRKLITRIIRIIRYNLKNG